MSRFHTGNRINILVSIPKIFLTLIEAKIIKPLWFRCLRDFLTSLANILVLKILLLKMLLHYKLKLPAEKREVFIF
ncbi:MAG TPA: hypothetical protein DEO71_08280 [Chryseobacterium sp.]|nr:hypothetical protein [Chryseobacterium sp.]